MRQVRCVVDLHDVNSKEKKVRTKAFHKLCLVMMLLRVWDRTELKCNCGCNGTRAWVVDWREVDEKVQAMKQVGG